MTKLRLKFVQAWVDREGRAHHYFRRAGYPRVRLPGLPGSPEFNRAYEAALGSAPEPVGAARIKPGSVAAAIASYRGSGAFKDHLSTETQGVRGAVLDAFGREHGDKMIRHMPRKFLVALFDGMEPTTAKNWRTAIRALCQHAVEADMLNEDPTLGIRLRTKKGEGSEGIHTWDEGEIARFERVHPIGSRERLALALGLYTAQRRGDVMRMGRQHIRQTPEGEVLYVRQQKTGTPLLLPIHPELRAVLGRSTHVPHDGARQAVHARHELHQLVRKSLRQGRAPGGLHVSRTPQGGGAPRCRGGMQRERDRSAHRPRQSPRSGALHEGGGSVAARARGDGAYDGGGRLSNANQNGEGMTNIRPR